MSHFLKRFQIDNNQHFDSFQENTFFKSFELFRVKRVECFRDSMNYSTNGTNGIFSG